MNKKSRLFIAGHKGFAGSSIYNKYLDEGYKNLIVRSRKELDLQDSNKVKKFFKKEKPEFVILAAARVGGIMDNIVHQADFLYENLEIQNNVIWNSHLYDVKKLMFLGSSCIYPFACPQPIKEEYFMTKPLEPTNEGYSIAKIAGMKLCEKIADQYKKNFISIMPSNLYGPRDNFHPLYSHVIPSLIRKFVEAKEKKQEFVEIWGDGKPRREFLYVEDFADAVYFLMKSYDNSQFINVGSGVDIAMKDLANKLKQLIGYEGKLVYDSDKPSGMKRRMEDVSKLNALGWKAKTTLEEGLDKTIKWFLENRNLLN